MVFGGVLIGGLHVLAAAVLVGGSYFMNFIVPAGLKALEGPQAGKVNMELGKRFTIVAWASIGVIVLTGIPQAAFLGALKPEVLLGSTYGYLLVGKVVLLIVAIVNARLITSTGVRLGRMAAQTPPPAAEMGTALGRIKSLSMTNLVLGIIIIVFAVSMRVIGLPQ